MCANDSAAASTTPRMNSICRCRVKPGNGSRSGFKQSGRYFALALSAVFNLALLPNHTLPLFNGDDSVHGLDRVLFGFAVRPADFKTINPRGCAKPEMGSQVRL